MSTNTITVSVNGAAKQLPGEVTVAGLLGLLGLSAQRVAVELNAQVVRRADHGSTPLHEGDQIEVVTFVGGG